jgi:hypothetical protein
LFIPLVELGQHTIFGGFGPPQTNVLSGWVGDTKTKADIGAKVGTISLYKIINGENVFQSFLLLLFFLLQNQDENKNQ